jgi:methionyl-tRNA formyltransferase
MNVLLVGEESAGIQVLKATTRMPHRIVAVLASPNRQSGASATMWHVAEHMGLPVWPAELVKDPAFARQVVDGEVDIVLNVHSLYIFHSEVISAPTIRGLYRVTPA